MVRLISTFMILFLSLPILGSSQEASRYYPLAQENTWVYYHEHIIEEGTAIKPAISEKEIVTVDTVTVKVNGTISALGNTYAVLELDGEEWGMYRVEGNYLYRLVRDGVDNYFEKMIVDFTPSSDDLYIMNEGGYATPRTFETKLLPCGELTGYNCVIAQGLTHHTAESLFFVESIGPAYISLLNGWAIPPEYDKYYLFSYDIKQVSVVMQEVHMPDAFELLPTVPNPFNLSTTIQYNLPQDSQIILSVYNISGQLIHVLKDEYQFAGNYILTWDATGFPSGLYFCIMQSNGFTKTRKMVLVK
ncbi:T9SS type A sorting domain-containing protein [Candidatus Latescibacterota bacterium]